MKKIFAFYLIITGLFSCSTTGDNSEFQIARVSEEIKGVVIPKIPESMIFCGKELDLRNEFVRERLDLELVINTHYHSATILGIKRSKKYFPEIELILAENELPDDLKYLCLIESNLSQATSPSGAKGFWQFMPATAKNYGLRVNDQIDERLHIEKSTRAACEYLKNAYGEFGDWSLAAAAYNRGIGGIKNDVEEQKVNDYYKLHLNKETARYVFRILAMKLILESPEDYGFVMTEDDAYKSIPTKRIAITSTVRNLVDFAQQHKTTLFEIKQLNPWIIGNKLIVKSDTLEIDIPLND